MIWRFSCSDHPENVRVFAEMPQYPQPCGWADPDGTRCPRMLLFDPLKPARPEGDTLCPE